MLKRRLAVILAAFLVAYPVSVAGQMQVPFGGFDHDRNAPVEVTADELSVSQADGTATFTGNVVVGQGELRLSAQSVLVEYGPGGGRIARLHAEGGVTLVTGAQAAEAQQATYDIDAAQVVMTGEVLLTEGPNAIGGDRLVVNLADGTGRMEGRVRTILQGGGAQ